GIIGRKPAHGADSRVLISGKCLRHQTSSGAMRAVRISQFMPLNSAVPAAGAGIGEIARPCAEFPIRQRQLTWINAAGQIRAGMTFPVHRPVSISLMSRAECRTGIDNRSRNLMSLPFFSQQIST
ncbi:MAG: hypothetical protein JZU55_20675, partial [Afipia sp.]|nr:hypothetical protein [Afipia sp.]